MRLVYTATQLPVNIGDEGILDAPIRRYTVKYFRPPHKPSSSGNVTIEIDGQMVERYVSVIGAEWIEREDRA